MSNGQLWAIALLFIAGFSVKMGTMPFHLWQAPAYAFSPGPASAFLGSISARMGMFAIALVAFRLIGTHSLTAWPSFRLLRLTRPSGLDRGVHGNPSDFVAMRQNDARLLLGWHGVGQGGYMLLGLVMADSLGSAGGLLHVFNHASYQAILLMAVFAVIHRTGTSDLNRLGGLVARMPLSFLAMLIGIIGLAGLPPMNGFVSKWMIYRALIIDGHPLLFVATVVSTLGTVSASGKLLHNTFLGQLRLEHETVREAPWSMTVPMLLLCVVVFVTGVAPGLVLQHVAAAQQAIGFVPVDFILGGVEGPERQPRHALDHRDSVCRLRRRRSAVLPDGWTQQARAPARQLRRWSLPHRRRAVSIQRQLLCRTDAPDQAVVSLLTPLPGPNRPWYLCWESSAARHAGFRSGQSGVLGAGRHHRFDDLDDVACIGLSCLLN